MTIFKWRDHMNLFIIATIIGIREFQKSMAEYHEESDEEIQKYVQDEMDRLNGIDRTKPAIYVNIYLEGDDIIIELSRIHKPEALGSIRCSGEEEG